MPLSLIRIRQIGTYIYATVGFYAYFHQYIHYIGCDWHSIRFTLSSISCRFHMKHYFYMEAMNVFFFFCVNRKLFSSFFARNFFIKSSTHQIDLQIWFANVEQQQKKKERKSDSMTINLFSIFFHLTRAQTHKHKHRMDTAGRYNNIMKYAQDHQYVNG